MSGDCADPVLTACTAWPIGRQHAAAAGRCAHVSCSEQLIPNLPPQPACLQLMMGTFIIAFIGNSLVDSASGSTGPLKMLPSPMRRRVLVLLYFGLILSVVVTLGVVTVSKTTHNLS